MNIPLLRPAGCPVGVQPQEWRAALSERIDRHAAILSHLIDALDTMDGDCDIEFDDALEPWLGWVGTGPSRYDSRDDREINECAVAK